jgi:hypothetical protein
MCINSWKNVLSIILRYTCCEEVLKSSLLACYVSVGVVFESEECRPDCNIQLCVELWMLYMTKKEGLGVGYFMVLVCEE